MRLTVCSPKNPDAGRVSYFVLLTEDMDAETAALQVWHVPLLLRNMGRGEGPDRVSGFSLSGGRRCCCSWC